MATFAQMCNHGMDVSVNSTDLIGESVTIRGVQYRANVDSGPTMESFGGGGSVEGCPITITIKRTLVPTDLRMGEKVTYDGQDFTIRQPDDDNIAFVTLIGDKLGKRG